MHRNRWEICWAFSSLISFFFSFPTDTTDVQSITVVPGKMDARVTCNFAVGSSCQACQLKWMDINSGVSSAGKTAMRKERDSCMATTIISPLTPGHTYSITAADVERGGAVSSVEVMGENFTTDAQGQCKLNSWWGCRCCIAVCIDLAISKRKVLCTWWVSN